MGDVTAGTDGLHLSEERAAELKDRTKTFEIVGYHKCEGDTRHMQSKMRRATLKWNCATVS
jgi:hypothetical protein